jgi:hypothetical protein
MTAVQTYRIYTTTAWWWTWLYLPAVFALMALGMTPDWTKVERAAVLAVRVRLVLVDSRLFEA